MIVNKVLRAGSVELCVRSWFEGRTPEHARCLFTFTLNAALSTFFYIALKKSQHLKYLRQMPFYLTSIT